MAWVQGTSGAQRLTHKSSELRKCLIHAFTQLKISTEHPLCLRYYSLSSHKLVRLWSPGPLHLLAPLLQSSLTPDTAKAFSSFKSLLDVAFSMRSTLTALYKITTLLLSSFLAPPIFFTFLCFSLAYHVSLYSSDSQPV